jgi:AbrB family transcriptional regulator (stage V sporulation protein T)
MDKRISRQLEQIMEDRQAVRTAGQLIPLCEDSDRVRVLVAVPILSEGDVLGSVLFVSDKEVPPPGEVEVKLAQTVAGFLGKHMES